MAEIMKLVRTYRMTTALDQRLSLAEELFRLIAPELRFYAFSAVPPDAGDDVSQEIFKAIATSLKRFAGDTLGEFWAWCYRIARNKISDHFRKQSADRLQPMPPEELWRLIDGSQQQSRLVPADRLDLEYAMQLLRRSRPDCYDLLWKHFVIGLAYAEIASEQNLNYDNVRIKLARCLDEAQSLIS